MVKISIIGFGNVAQHLAAAFESNPAAELVQIYSRKPQTAPASFSRKLIHDLGELDYADVYIISVSDDAVAQVAAALRFENRLVVHTAGSLPMDILDAKNRAGVFYPLQTFSRNKAVDFREVPICIEACNATDLKILESIAKSISPKVYAINSNQRRSLHVAAVFASNFANHMYKIGSDICEEHGVPFDILKPLIQETAAKIKTLSPRQAQTGPAIRNDTETIAAHLAWLSDDNQRNIYQLLTQSIQHEREKL